MFKWLHRRCHMAYASAIDRMTVVINEKEELSKTITNMLTEINTQRGILEYSMHEKEQHIESLMAEIECLKKELGQICNQNADQSKRQEEVHSCYEGHCNPSVKPDHIAPKSRFDGKGIKPSEFAQRYNNLPSAAVPLVEKKKKDADNAKKYGSVRKNATNKAVKEKK